MRQDVNRVLAIWTAVCFFGAALSVVGVLACFLAGIWTAGKVSDNLFMTALWFCFVTLAFGCAAGMCREAQDR